MATIQITPVGSLIPATVLKQDFLNALEQSDAVNDVIEIKGKQYILSSVLLSEDIPIALTLYVDAASGNNTTAVRGSFTKRYQTGQAAKTAALSGDKIVFLPGNHGNTGNMFKPNVHIHVEEGATFSDITFNDAAFIGTACKNFVTGFLRCLTGGRLFDLTNTLTEFYIHGDEYIAFNSQPMRASKIKYLKVRWRKLDCRNYRCIRIDNTESDIEIDELDGTQMSIPNFNVEVEGMLNKEHRIKIKVHKSISDGALLVYEDNVNFTGKLIYEGDINHTHQAPTGSLSNCINVIYGGKLELKNCHIKTNTTAVWLMDNLGNGCKGSVKLDGCVIDATTGINPAIKTSGNDRYVFAKDCVLKSKATRGAIELGVVNAFGDQTNGKLEMHNCKVINYDNDVMQNVMNIGGGVPALNNVVFENGHTAGKSIGAASPQNIKTFSGISGNCPLDATITVLAGNFIFDSNLVGNFDIN